jgi:hypothetical protein
MAYQRCVEMVYTILMSTPKKGSKVIVYPVIPNLNSSGVHVQYKSYSTRSSHIRVLPN